MPRAKELMRAGELYPGDDPQLNRDLDRRQAMVTTLNTIPNDRMEDRHLALAHLLAEIGEETQVRAPFYCDWGDGIRIGARSFLNFNCVLLDGAEITVGDECLFAAGVQLATATHPIDPAARRGAWEQALPIEIGDGVWLGSGAIVGPGVSIGENTVVGAGSVVTRSLPDGVIAYGTPARVMREIGERDRTPDAQPHRRDRTERD
jgi:maltose O-acetyltransferase